MDGHKVITTPTMSPLKKKLFGPHGGRAMLLCKIFFRLCAMKRGIQFEVM